jgi:hypothetical protein
MEVTMTGISKPPTLNIVPMGVAGVQHLVERAYRESGEMQYIRELLVNAIEAGATRIEFGPEWNAVQYANVYRLMVADNGRGMTKAELLRFLNTFGGGGKPIGAAHENFGIGAKTSLLPWNQAGVVVVSWTEAEPEGGLVWLMRDPQTGEYGARKFLTSEGWRETVPPSEVQDLWANIRPPWMTTGTVVVAMGNSGRDDTFLGKSGRGDTKEISQYLNKRFWEIPDSIEVYVQELRYTAKKNWPRTYEEASKSPAPKSGSKAVDRRWNRRRVRGAKFFVTQVEGKVEAGSLEESGTVKLNDGAEVDWYLWEGKRPGIHAHAHEFGYISALYRNELYDVQSHPAQYRTFGITQRAVRENLTIVVRPPLLKDGEGVYPDSARNTLKTMGRKKAGEPLPWPEWGYQFADRMPEAIKRALSRAGPEESTGSLLDQRWRDRLADRFGKRWSTLRYLIVPRGQHRTTPTEGRALDEPVSETDDTIIEPTGVGNPRQAPPPKALGPAGKDTIFGLPNPLDDAQAQLVTKKGGIPEWKWGDGSEVDEGCAASWVPAAPDHPNGVVLMSRAFPTFEEVKRYWRQQYPDHLSEIVDRVVEEVYGEAMVARVAHSEELCHTKLWGHARVETELRSSASLTMAALGLVSEDLVIATRLGGIVGRKSTKEKGDKRLKEASFF